MENYENKELLKDAAKKSLESLKDLKPGTEEYNTAANMALKLYDMQLKDEAQENEKQLKEDEAIAEADTLLLTIPNMLGVEYNVHVLDSILRHVAPAMGWR